MAQLCDSVQIFCADSRAGILQEYHQSQRVYMLELLCKQKKSSLGGSLGMV